jgi:DNA-directed RNA polymerase sigma subunit (sigma70/sigma32)
MGNIDLISSTTLEEEQESFLPYYLGDTPEEAEETYETFSWLLGIMAGAYADSTDISLEDYFGEAVTGLARAKRDWDPTRGGCQFKTFAIMKIKNSLNEYCRKNSSIVKVPHYVRVANTYVTNIKTIFEGLGIPEEYLRMTLEKGEQHRDRAISDADSKMLDKELKKLKTLAKNSEVTLENLVKRAEFIPTDMSYDESMTQEQLHVREQRRLAAALMVSKLEDQMTEDELHVAHGIMAGKSYAEIGRTHPKKYSIAWVQKKVNEMREKFQRKDDHAK